MRLRVKEFGTNLTPEDTATIERRVHFSLVRFVDRFRRTEVLLLDSDGRRGGRNHHCTVLVVPTGLPSVVVDVDPLAAVSRAVERAARRVRDSAGRQRDLQRRPGRGTRANAT